MDDSNVRFGVFRVVTMGMEAIYSSETSVVTQESHGVVIFQKTAFFILTAVKTPNLILREISTGA
jgi:hypothetical protein